jgi:coenzyme F420-0:L-glutamate ligase/coenzyme F420-1:gamma-L-glutamate ligase
MVDATTNLPAVRMWGIPGLPLVQPGDDLTALLLEGLHRCGLRAQTGDVLVLAQKIVSKAEGRAIPLRTVEPTPQAIELARQCEKDPRLVQVILDESQEIMRVRPGVIIVRHRLGFVCANAGVDRSNVSQVDEDETVLRLPLAPDGSAVRLRQQLLEATGQVLAVIIADSHGRPHRLGTIGVALGSAGLPALQNRRGEEDLFGYRLQHTEVALADLFASAASLILGQAAEGVPAVLIRGLSISGEGRAMDLNRPVEMDLFR